MTKLQPPSLTQVKLRLPSEGSMLRLCQALDFNCVRLPYSLEMHLDQPDVRSGYRISPSTETHPQRETNIVYKGIGRFWQSFWMQKWNIHLIPVTNLLKSLNLVNTKVIESGSLEVTPIDHHLNACFSITREAFCWVRGSKPSISVTWMMVYG